MDQGTMAGEGDWHKLGCFSDQLPCSRGGPGVEEQSNIGSMDSKHHQEPSPHLCVPQKILNKTLRFSRSFLGLHVERNPS